MSQAQSTRIMTYNIRFDNPADSPHTWVNRKPLILNQIRDFDSDIIGLQEALFGQVRDLEVALLDYERIGVGRDDGINAGEFSPLFIKKDRFEILDQGTFWLSDTPDQVSIGWDASMERIATWALIKNIVTKDSTLVVNTHFDHVGKIARLESIKLINTFISEDRFKGIDKIVMGDFNTGPDTEPYKWFVKNSLLNDTYYSAINREGPVGTFNSFNYEHLSPRIDYIFVSPTKKVKQYKVLQTKIDGILPSDHWPVMVIIE